MNVQIIKMQRNGKLKHVRTSNLATWTPPKSRGPAAHEPAFETW